jgi:hypothetical protein
MTRALMVVVAGPAGSGKSRHFPVDSSGCDDFNVDLRAAALNGGTPSRARCVCEPRRSARRSCWTTSHGARASPSRPRSAPAPLSSRRGSTERRLRDAHDLRLCRSPRAPEPPPRAPEPSPRASRSKRCDAGVVACSLRCPDRNAGRTARNRAGAAPARRPPPARNAAPALRQCSGSLARPRSLRRIFCPIIACAAPGGDGILLLAGRARLLRCEPSGMRRGFRLHVPWHAGDGAAASCFPGWALAVPARVVPLSFGGDDGFVAGRSSSLASTE